MLVLSRKTNESLVINHNITVTVVEIRADKVRLGIVHPKDTSVHRQEVFELIHGRESNPATWPTQGVEDSRTTNSPSSSILSNPAYQIQHKLSFDRSAPEARQVIDFAAGMGKSVPNAERIEIVFTQEEWKRLLSHFRFF